jgi:regulatory protein
LAENLLYKTALSKAMHLCSEREWCKSDIRQKLISWGVGTEDAEKILEILIRDKYIDELRYASAFTSDKFRYNKWGKIKIGTALRVKRIPSGIISQALQAIDSHEYTELLKSIIEKKRRSVKAKNQYDLKGKLLRHCLSKGFESELIYEMLNLED